MSLNWTIFIVLDFSAKDTLQANSPKKDTVKTEASKTSVKCETIKKKTKKPLKSK